MVNRVHDQTGNTEAVVAQLRYLVRDVELKRESIQNKKV